MEALRKLTDDAEFPEGTRWHYRPFTAGEILIREGHQSDALYLVDRGKVEVTATIELGDGQQAVPALCVLGAGQVFGELGLFLERPRTASVRGETDGVLIEFDGAALREYMKSHTEVGYEIVKALFQTVVERLGAANKQMAYMAAWGLRPRRRPAG